MASDGHTIEKRIRKSLEKELEKRFEENEKQLDIYCGSTGQKVKHRFDLVSEDREVIGEVDSSKYNNGRNYADTRKPRLIEACFYLERVKAKRKLLVLTDKELWNKFKGEVGRLVPNIEILWR